MTNYITGNISGHRGHCKCTHTSTHGDQHVCLQDPRSAQLDHAAFKNSLPHTPKHTQSNSTLLLSRRFNLQQTDAERKDSRLRKLMFAFWAVSISNSSVFVEKTSQRRCEIAQVKHCQTSPAAFVLLFNTVLCVPVRIEPRDGGVVFLSRMRRGRKYSFPHIKENLSGTDISLELYIDVISY